MPDEGEVAECIHKDGGDAVAMDSEPLGLHLSNEPRSWRLKLVHMDQLPKRGDSFGRLGTSSNETPRFPAALSSNVAWAEGNHTGHKLLWKHANLGPHASLRKVSKALMPVGP